MTKQRSKTQNNKQKIKYVSDWESNKKLDYVILTFPNQTDNPGSPTGKGIIADVARNCFYASFKAILVDVPSSEIVDASTISRFKEFPIFTKEISQQFKHRVKKYWE
jgi:hypothetical protein